MSQSTVKVALEFIVSVLAVTEIALLALTLHILFHGGVSFAPSPSRETLATLSKEDKLRYGMRQKNAYVGKLAVVTLFAMNSFGLLYFSLRLQKRSNSSPTAKHV